MRCDECVAVAPVGPPPGTNAPGRLSRNRNQQYDSRGRERLIIPRGRLLDADRIRRRESQIRNHDPKHDPRTQSARDDATHLGGSDPRIEETASGTRRCHRIDRCRFSRDDRELNRTEIGTCSLEHNFEFARCRTLGTGQQCSGNEHGAHERKSTSHGFPLTNSAALDDCINAAICPVDSTQARKSPTSNTPFWFPIRSRNVRS